MRLTLTIDSVYHQIDSTDPEMLGKWIIEIFGRIHEWTPATYVTVQAWPSYLQRADGSFGADWLTDSRVLGQVHDIRSPKELLAALQKELDQAADLVP